MVRRSTSCRWLNPLETHLGQIERTDKHIDHPNGSVHCARSASSTKRLIDPSQNHEGIITAAQHFHTARVITGRTQSEHNESAYGGIATTRLLGMEC
jgi:hypothetical protein